MDTQNALLVALARLLVGNQVKPQAVEQALRLLCEYFKMDCGIMCETDEYNQLSLIQHYGEKIKVLDQDISLDEISPKLYQALAQKDIMLCSRATENAPEEAELLAILSAETVAAVAAVDEAGRIFAVTVICRTRAPQTLNAQQHDSLAAALGMLSRYTAVSIYQRRLSFAQTALESVLDNTGIDIYVNDFNSHDILYVNESMAAPYGGRARFAGKKCWAVLFPEQNGPCEFCPQKKIIDEDGNPTKIYTWDYQRAFDGSWFRVFSAAFRWTDGRLAHVVSSADITDNKRNEELIQYMANYDDLTNLPNRRRLVTDCERRIGPAGEKAAQLLFFDIDGFKKINDTLGHEAGDEFLVQLGEFFSGIPMLKDSIYRNGGDEFVALLGERVTEENVRNLAQFIHTRFKKPWVLKLGTVMCGTSIGVARYPMDGTTAEELLRKADLAMYDVKKSGGGGIHFAGE